MNTNNADDRFGLAQGRTTIGKRGGVAPLFIGAAQICADSAPSLVASIKKCELVALTDTGLTTFVPGTHSAAQAVIASVPCTAIGQNINYWNEGEFNMDAIVFPRDPADETGKTVHASFNSIAKLKAFFNGTNLKFGHTI